jgi:methylmalonyl-CoA mutase
MSDAGIPLVPEFDAASREAWLKLVDKVLKGAHFSQRLVSRTADGISISPLYGRADAAAGPDSAAYAGGFPARWDIRQRHAEPDPRRANAAILEDLTGGVTSLLLQIEAPGQAGLPYGAERLAAALKGVYLDSCAIALDARENTMDAAGSLLEIWREANVSENVRRGAFNVDPLGVLAATGTLYYPADRSCEIAAKFAFDCRTMSHVWALAADARPYHEAGASEAQELAAMLATLVAYLRACEQASLRPRAAFGKIALGLSADADLFLTIAKLRAARKLVARVAEACGAGSSIEQVHINVSTSERMMARRDPWVNMLRTTVACAGAAFGGANAVTVLPFSWALGRPDAFARRIARNTHLVLQEESSLARVADPAAGAWFVEKLTGDLAAAAWALFQQIEGQGGMARALESGFIQEQVAKTAEARGRDVATARMQLIGVSAFPMLAEAPVKAEPHPPAPPVVTGGTSVPALTPHRLSAPFERLRDAADAYASRAGHPPRVFLASLGDPAVHSARSTWTRNFLAAGGIDVIASGELHNSADAGNALAASGATVACICSSDAVYLELGEAVAGALKSAGAARVLLAGRPRKQEAELRAAGVDDFIYAGCDAIAVLGSLHGILNVTAR